MPTTSTFRSRHSRRIDWSSGISWRHGAHQVAQKLIINDLPRQVAMEIGSPVRPPNENSGRCSGIFGRTGPPGASAVPAADSKGASKSPAAGGLASPAATRTPASGAPGVGPGPFRRLALVHAGPRRIGRSAPPAIPPAIRGGLELHAAGVCRRWRSFRSKKPAKRKAKPPPRIATPSQGCDVAWGTADFAWGAGAALPPFGEKARFGDRWGSTTLPLRSPGRSL